jgi:hypothetical protein
MLARILLWEVSDVYDELDENEKNDCGVTNSLALLDEFASSSIQDLDLLSSEIGLNPLINEEVKSFTFTTADKLKNAKKMIEDSYNDCFLITSKNKQLLEVLRESTIIKKLDKGSTLEFNSQNPLDQIIMIRMGSLSVAIEIGEETLELELEDGDVISNFMLSDKPLLLSSIKIKAITTSSLYLFTEDIFTRFMQNKARVKLAQCLKLLSSIDNSNALSF